ncbi:MAG TPA: hypothetical protein V6D48_09940 [Oculatellaceae cyanobacterium]
MGEFQEGFFRTVKRDTQASHCYAHPLGRVFFPTTTTKYKRSRSWLYNLQQASHIG